jgi:8-oxo-dGTP pyrophosphatase MutT (NUDIX family)
VSQAEDQVEAEARAAAGAPEAGPASRQAAVLVPVFRDEHGDVRIVLIHRAPGGIHGDQLAFPGGVAEPGDPTLLDTALRESEEEIGLDPSSVELLEALPLFTTRASGISIAPFLGRILRPEHWRPHQREIAAVIEPRLVDLADPAARSRIRGPFGPKGEERQLPCIRVGDQRLWGASLRILDPVLPRLLAGEWQF